MREKKSLWGGAGTEAITRARKERRWLRQSTEQRRDQCGDGQRTAQSSDGQSREQSGDGQRSIEQSRAQSSKPAQRTAAMARAEHIAAMANAEHRAATASAQYRAAKTREEHRASIFSAEQRVSPRSAATRRQRAHSYRCCLSQAVAIVAGDAVGSMDSKAFLKRADAGCRPCGVESGPQFLPSPVIPHGYSRCTRYQQQKYGLSREQLAMVSVLMSRQASRHPYAMTRKAHTLQEVLQAPEIAPSIGLLECARRADGGAAVVVASSRLLERRALLQRGNGGRGDVVILGGGEASGPLYPPAVIDESMFSCEQAAKNAWVSTQLQPEDIDWWGLYDCFPICFVRAVEAVGLASPGKGGEWVEEHYHLTGGDRAGRFDYDPAVFPVNTHGGLLAFGAPWEVPAMYNVCEAVVQLTGQAVRQVRPARRALVYGNGGVFSASAVALLARAVTT
eukprot:g50399.t1